MISADHPCLALEVPREGLGRTSPGLGDCLFQDIPQGCRLVAKKTGEGRIGRGKLTLSARGEETKEHISLRLGNAIGDHAVPVLVIRHDDPPDLASRQLRGDRRDAGGVDRFGGGEGGGRSVDSFSGQDNRRRFGEVGTGLVQATGPSSGAANSPVSRAFPSIIMGVGEA